MSGASADRYILAQESVEINQGREVVKLKVKNTGDRPVQVGSHFHFFEVNRALKFNRSLAFGKRLAIPAGTAVRFEPGDEREVSLIRFGGQQRAYGFNNLVNGSVTIEQNAILANDLARKLGFKFDK